MDYVIRQLTRQDEPILWEMLYYGLSSGGKDEPPPRDVVHRPEIARYVEGWGRVGDTGFVAHGAAVPNELRCWLLGDSISHELVLHCARDFISKESA